MFNLDAAHLSARDEGGKADTYKATEPLTAPAALQKSFGSMARAMRKLRVALRQILIS